MGTNPTYGEGWGAAPLPSRLPTPRRGPATQLPAQCHSEGVCPPHHLDHTAQPSPASLGLPVLSPDGISGVTGTHRKEPAWSKPRTLKGKVTKEGTGHPRESWGTELECLLREQQQFNGAAVPSDQEGCSLQTHFRNRDGPHQDRPSLDILSDTPLSFLYNFSGTEWVAFRVG